MSGPSSLKAAEKPGSMHTLIHTALRIFWKTHFCLELSVFIVLCGAYYQTYCLMPLKEQWSDNVNLEVWSQHNRFPYFLVSPGVSSCTHFLLRSWQTKLGAKNIWTTKQDFSLNVGKGNGRLTKILSQAPLTRFSPSSQPRSLEGDKWSLWYLSKFNSCSEENEIMRSRLQKTKMYSSDKKILWVKLWSTWSEIIRRVSVQERTVSAASPEKPTRTINTDVLTFFLPASSISTFLLICAEQKTNKQKNKRDIKPFTCCLSLVSVTSWVCQSTLCKAAHFIYLSTTILKSLGAVNQSQRSTPCPFCQPRKQQKAISPEFGRKMANFSNCFPVTKEWILF